MNWTDGADMFGPPTSIRDLEDEEMVRQLVQTLERSHEEMMIGTAFPAETYEEEKTENEDNTFDAILGEEDIGIAHDVQAQEHEMFEEIPLPSIPSGEAERKRRWLKLPRPARVAIRR